MPEGQLLMTQAERDRLVALKKAKKKLITQKEAAEELGITERHVRRLLRELKRLATKWWRTVCGDFPPPASSVRIPNGRGWRSCRGRCTGDLGRRWPRSSSPRNTTSRRAGRR